MLNYKTNLKNVLFLFILFNIVFLPTAFAHLDAGEDRVINNYLIDFGYAPENPKITDKIILAFNLVNDTTKEVIEPTSVWIRISSSKEVVFAGTFHPEAQHIAFTYTFPYADDYEITVRFKDSNDTLVETDFKVKIQTTSGIYIFIGIILLIIIGFIVTKIRKRKK